MPTCSSRVLFGLELSARARSRNRILQADVFGSSPVGGCKYESYVRYISTDEQLYVQKFQSNDFLYIMMHELSALVLSIMVLEKLF